MLIPVLPETAPFTPSQRAWLNGFFAGLLSSAPGPQAWAGASSSGAPTNGTARALPPEIEESFAWHDPALEMDERLRLAEGKPLPRVFMAAMAQLDCGACGYLCKTYGEAIAIGAEKNLGLCAPGGAVTARKLKELMAKAGGPWPSADPKEPQATVERPAGYSRKHPFAARLVKSARLNAPGSEKDTRHVVLDLEGSGIIYEPGDSLGVFPENCPELVEAILKALRASGDETVPVPSAGERPLREALLSHYTVSRPCEELLELLAGPVKDVGRLETCDVLDLLEDRVQSDILPADFVSRLPPLQPRLYSISSSLKTHPDEVHLTVAVVRYNVRGRVRKGVASTYLSDRVKPGQRVRVFVQPTHGFRLPADGAAPVILIGPGTGVAPFRAFLEERKACGHSGKSWLFFGDQHRAHDFLFREELEAFHRDGTLSRLDTAFSRDQEEKVYVQHKMLENSAEVWSWLETGAHVYVCGDAKRMAKDVDAALKQIAATQGRMTDAAARGHIEGLARTGRYLRDVY